MKIAVVGATGMVGNVMLEVLEERKFPITDLLLVASERSVGKVISYGGKEYTVIGLQEAVDQKPDIALFSAGGSTSLEWAPKFAEAGTTVVDNSSAWRMDPTKKLIVSFRFIWRVIHVPGDTSKNCEYRRWYGYGGHGRSTKEGEPHPAGGRPGGRLRHRACWIRHTQDR